MVVENLRSCQAEDQHRHPGQCPRESCEQVDEYPLAPLDVVDHNDERTLPCRRDQNAPDRPRELLRGRRATREPQQLSDLSGDGLSVGSRSKELLELGARRLERLILANLDELAHDFAETPVRDPFAVGEAGAPGDTGATFDAPQQLRGEP
jgi:hypothetical protein